MVSALADRIEELMEQGDLGHSSGVVTPPKGGLYGEFWPGVMSKLHDRAPGWLSPSRQTPRWHRLVLPAKKTGAWYALRFTQEKHLEVTLFLKPRVWKKAARRRSRS